MKRMHINLSVNNLEQSIKFYTTLFAAPPTVRKPDYAKWMLDDPRVNFAIAARGHAPGVDHLGIQVDDRVELQDLARRLNNAGRPVLNQGAVTCCYSRSEKSWITDPQGVAWETFLSLGDSPVYGADTALDTDDEKACCERPDIAGPPDSHCC